MYGRPTDKEIQEDQQYARTYQAMFGLPDRHRNRHSNRHRTVRYLNPYRSML